MGLPRSVLGVFLLSGALACGDSGGGKGNQQEEPVPASGACTALAEALCTGLRRCEIIGDDLIADCRWYFEETLACSTRYRLMAQDIRAGLIEYDAAAFGRCLEKITRSGSCDAVGRHELLRFDPDCTSFTSGTIAPGEPCTADACDGGDCLGSCPAVCEPRPAVGSPCTGFCGNHLKCLNGLCAPPGDIGEPCQTNSAAPECLPGLVCAGVGTEGTCAAPGREGESCNQPGRPACSILLDCLPTPGGGPDTCQPFLPDGSPCDPTVGGCRPSSKCIGGACQPRRGFGQACGSSAPCLPYYDCDAGTCVHKRPLGSTCSTTNTCLIGLCQGGNCRLSVSEGGFCDDTSLVCAQGSCVEGHCQGGCP